MDLSGNGYEFDPDDFIHWRFIAPPYDIGNFHKDITGRITLLFLAGHDINQVPDGGLTLGMFAAALTGLAAMRKRMRATNTLAQTAGANSQKQYCRLESIAETQPQLQPALLRLSAMISRYFT